MNQLDQKELNRREIEEALENLTSLEKKGFYNVPKITWWVLKYEDLFEYSYSHRHDGSCIEGMGCGCSWNNPESHFCDLFSGLQEVVNLHQYEINFKKEMETYNEVRDDYPALMQWLKRNEKLGTEDFFLFWVEWYDEEEGSIIPLILNWQELGIKFKTEEWQNSIRFLEVFNDIYWTSEACSPLTM